MAHKGNTTVKHEDFINRPMGRRPVTDVPGIGDAIGASMERARIVTAKKLYGIYLTCNRAEFKGVVERHGGNAKHQQDAYTAMKEWEEQNG